MKKHMLLAHLAASVALLAVPASAQTAAATPTAAATTAIYAPITVAEVEAAQTAWCGALVAIATEADTKGLAAAKVLAGQVIDSAYAYNMGPVLFKPTLTVAPQTFRTTRAGALSYFVGGDSAYPADGGFALKHWRRCQSETETAAGAAFGAGNGSPSSRQRAPTQKRTNITTPKKTQPYSK